MSGRTAAAISALTLLLAGLWELHAGDIAFAATLIVLSLTGFGLIWTSLRGNDMALAVARAFISLIEWFIYW